MLSINEYLVNMVAGNSQITNLYSAVDRAIDITNKDNKFQRFNRRITFNGIGSKVYSSEQLVNFENLSFCLTFTKILEESRDPNKLTLDEFIILMLKGRNTIRHFFQSCCHAGVAKSEAKMLCYTYINPYPNTLVSLNVNKKSFNSANSIISFFCKSENKPFDARLIFNKIYFDEPIIKEIIE